LTKKELTTKEQVEKFGYACYKECDYCGDVKDYWTIMVISQQWDNHFITIFCSSICQILYKLEHSHPEVLEAITSYVNKTDQRLCDICFHFRKKDYWCRKSKSHVGVKKKLCIIFKEKVKKK
jgi:hypothetical protein